MRSTFSTAEVEACVPLDYFRAANWFTRAARQGIPRLRPILALSTKTARGVSLDYVAAYTWYYRATVAGDASGSSHLKNLAKIMTSKQLERAKAILLAEFPLSQSAPDESPQSGKSDHKQRNHH
jgi:TPR repeat protein